MTWPLAWWLFLCSHYCLPVSRNTSNQCDWHANVRWRFGPLEWLIATPAFHHWHHANEAEGQRDHNYAAMFPLIDLVFSTLHRPPAMVLWH
ncbi:sterol desaturase family protein [Iodobacter fluviatilis]|uniref:sterol desaturase family protein n=1 Tax=Iodobacter fluviatilis TaxID=537 RepID=UPI0030D80D71